MNSLLDKRKAKLDHADAKGTEFQVGQGTILLLAPTKDDGKTAMFLKQHGEGGILGASIEVGDLSSARHFLDENGVEHHDYAGNYGQSLLVSAERTQGMWLIK